MWSYMRANAGLGTEEQWLGRVDGVPAIAIKRNDDGWVAWVLCASGISAHAHYYPDTTPLENVKAAALAVYKTGD